MKKIVFVVLFSLISFSLYAQNEKVDSVLRKWVACFNKQDYQKAYDLYAPFYRDKVRLDIFTKNMKMVYGMMMGEIREIKFISFNGQYYKFILFAKSNQIEADVTLVVDSEYKFRYFNFDGIGGRGNPPPVAGNLRTTGS